MYLVPPLLLNAKSQGCLIDRLRWAITYGSFLATAANHNLEDELPMTIATYIIKGGSGYTS